MRHCLLTKFLLLGCAVAAFGPTPAKADFTTLYDNTTTSTGFYTNKGAATVGGTVATTMVADDITAGAGLGGFAVNQITFTVGNANSTAVTLSPQLLFYQADPTTFAPSTLIAVLNISPITVAAGVGNLVTITDNSAGGFFTMPTGLFWAGVVFTDGGTASATAAQLNNVGQFTFNPPAVGSSQNAFFQSNSAGPSGNNPAGGFFQFTGGNPVANFGWTFATAQAVPEPSTLALSAVGGLVLVGVRLTRRRRSAGNSAIAA